MLCSFQNMQTFLKENLIEIWYLFRNNHFIEWSSNFKFNLLFKHIFAALLTRFFVDTFLCFLQKKLFVITTRFKWQYLHAFSIYHVASGINLCVSFPKFTVSSFSVLNTKSDFLTHFDEMQMQKIKVMYISCST